MYSSFLDNAINENSFIIGDPQFGSPVVYRHVAARRMFGSLSNLHESMIENWNAVVDDSDTVICLGDFTQNKKHRSKSLELIERFSCQLNGKKILIRGNHDVEPTQFYYDYGWLSVVEYPLIMLDQQTRWLQVPSVSAACIIKDIADLRIMFTHFAIFEDENQDRRYLLEKAYLRELFAEHACDVNIHGHTHDRPVRNDKSFSACVEQTFFSPTMLRDFLVINGLSRDSEFA